MGPAPAVRDRIAQVIPDVDWSDRTWGVCHRAAFTLELNMGDKDPIDSFMIHARGGGDVVELLLDLAKSSGWYLLDCSEGEWFHHHRNPDETWRRFQAYRDYVNQNDQA